jgi:quinoprotein glucose dehydrogenase
LFYNPGMLHLSAALLLAVSASIQPDDTDERVEAVWANPGMIVNPVSFTIDRFGRLYVVESARAGNAVTDTRQLGHLNAIEEDLQLKSVEDRRALIEKWIAQGAFEPDYFTRTEDRVVRVLDTDGDGLADLTNVFADGFNDAVDGIAAGALWLGDTFYLTNIPNLWALRDTDSDGAVDERESLAYGFGVRWCFYGHDLHGLVQGPDGRIYFSMGDRGFNITTTEGNHIVNPQTGGVFRCWPDGSELELFAQGLRNPQELAFDQWGNLFTGDNNCDSGDKARVVHVVEGSDSGWRQDVQSLPSRGPWNREKIWHTYDDPKDPVRPAWTLPPVAHVGAGPSGILYYPGTGENSRYDEHIFLVDFYGSGATVHTFRMDPAGAWFALADKGIYYKGKTVTDIAMGYDGRMYLSDWGGGWSPNPNGSIFTIENRTVHSVAGGAIIDEVESLFAGGFDTLETPRLVKLLGHRDQRVRLAAQYELAEPARDAAAVVARVAADTSGAASTLAQVHAIWCLRQMARRDAGAAASLRPLLADDDAQVRTQVVKMLGDLRDVESADRFLELLSDTSAPAQAAAATALGRIAYGPALEPLLDLLDTNDDADPVIRHCASYALALLDRPDELITAAKTRGEGARIGAVIALRRQKSLGLLAFVDDPSPRVAAEAIRAIYDERVDAGLPAIARFFDGDLPRPMRIEPVLRRALSANVLLGDAASARRLARFATLDGLTPVWRKLALDALLAWDKPLKRERVWGHWVDLPGRDASAAEAALVAALPALEAFLGVDDELDKRIESARARFGGGLTPDAMLAVLADSASPVEYRVALLGRLAADTPGRITEAAHAALADGAPAAARLRIEALNLLATVGGPAAVEALTHAIETGTTAEKQRAATLLGGMNDEDAVDLFARLAEGLTNANTDASLALEIIEAAGPDASASVRDAIAEFTDAAADPRFAPSVLASGGDAGIGEDIFFHHGAAQCLRCHTIGGQGGTAGPDLSVVGSRLPVTKLIESLLDPGAVVAAGYGTITLRLKDGKTIGGVLKGEKPGAYTIETMGETATIDKATVATTVGPVSAMPVMKTLLSPHELRDVAAFLVTRQDPAIGPALEKPGPMAHGGGSGRASSGTPLRVALMALVLPLLAVVLIIMVVIAVQLGDEASDAGGA